MNGLVYNETIDEIKNNIKKLSPEQKSSIAINKEDIQNARLLNFEFRKTNNKIFVRVSIQFFYTPKLRELLEKIVTSKQTNLSPNASEIRNTLFNLVSANYKYKYSFC